jgi:ABC-type multidrug transport system ATPase subunit/ABC-type multidrug transport system permease subunit
VDPSFHYSLILQTLQYIIAKMEGTPASPEQSQLENADGFAFIESVTVHHHTILQELNLTFPSNAVCAILGPSGSGKTTLMNLLKNNIPRQVKAKGVIHLPGAGAIVPQDDQLHGFYTCRSYLQHYARLCGIPREIAASRIEELLVLLGLIEQANLRTIVGDIFLKGLSGGQRRRLSIALEALSHPGLLFLDEPTSGLDAESALQVMDFLKTYARGAAGRRVILTIHQPSSFLWQTIDQVILLSKGKLMYQGPRLDMGSFFEWVGYPTPAGWNPADHYITAVNDEFRLRPLSVDEWAEKFAAYQPDDRVSSKHERTPSILLASQSPQQIMYRSKNPLRIATELSRRYFLNLAFNPGILGTRIAMYVMLALIVGALFWNLGHRNDLESVQSRVAILFYCVAFFVFMSVAVLPFTVMERAIVDKEVLNHYYHPAYYQLSQGIASIPSTALLAFLTTVIVVGMTKLNSPFWYFLDMFLALVVAEALAQLVSHVVPHFIIGMALLSGCYGLFMLVQGFMLVPSAFPNWLRWLYHVAFHSYAWRTFMVSEFGNNATFTGSDAYPTGQDVLLFYEIDDVNRFHDMMTLVGYALVVHCLSFLVLHLRYTAFRGKLEPPIKSMKARE